MKAVRIHEPGGPDKLTYEDVILPEPGPDQARVRVLAIGLNFIDIYYRTGIYKAPLPFVPGMEAAGVVDAVGERVQSVIVGDRVAYAMSMGSYAEYSIVDAWKLVQLPEAIDFTVGAAAMLQGMTAHYLSHSAYPLKNGKTALVHAAAGGVGLLLIQMAKMLGTRVIGTVSTEQKAALASVAGADCLILYQSKDFQEEVRKITNDDGVDVVYDSVGQATFQKSLNCLRRRGMLVLYGQSSGPVPPVDLNMLNVRGSLFVTRPGLAHYAAERDELRWRAADVLRWIQEGKLNITIDRKLPLSDAAQAHRALEGRQTAGKVILLP